MLDPKAAETYLSENFVFSDKELTEIIAAATTGDLSKLSPQTKEVLADIERAFNGVIPQDEILRLQANRLFQKMAVKCLHANYYNQGQR